MEDWMKSLRFVIKKSFSNLILISVFTNPLILNFHEVFYDKLRNVTLEKPD